MFPSPEDSSLAVSGTISSSEQAEKTTVEKRIAMISNSLDFILLLILVVLLLNFNF